MCGGGLLAGPPRLPLFIQFEGPLNSLRGLVPLPPPSGHNDACHHGAFGWGWCPDSLPGHLVEDENNVTSEYNYTPPESFRAIGPAPRIPGAGLDGDQSRRTLEVLPTIEGQYPTGRAGFIRRRWGGVHSLPHVSEG